MKNVEVLVKLEHVALLRVWMEVVEDSKITNIAYFNDFYVKLYIHFEIDSDYRSCVAFMQQFDDSFGDSNV